MIHRMRSLQVQSDATLGGGSLSVTAESTHNVTSDASTFGGGGLVIGIGIADANAAGTTQAEVDGQGAFTTGGATISSQSTEIAAADGTTTGVGLAAVAVNDTNANVTPTVIAALGQNSSLSAKGNVSINSGELTNATATASAFVLSAGVSVGDTPATATIGGQLAARIGAGATVSSTTGSIGVTAANNFDSTQNAFVPGNGATASTQSLTASLGVSVGDANVTATSDPSVTASVDRQSNLSAASGNVTVQSRSENITNSSSVNNGGAAIAVSSSSLTATSNGTTNAQLLGNVTHAGAAGAANVFVTSQDEDVATAGASSTGGGGISVTTSNINANSMPIVGVEAGGNIQATGNIQIQSASSTDAHTTSSSLSGGLVAVTNLSAQSLATPSVTATVDGGAIIAAGGSLTISAVHGAAPPVLSNGTFGSSNVNTANNSIDLGLATGLLTGDTVTYSAQGHTAIGGLIDGQTYGVIFVSPTILKLGASYTVNPSTPGVGVNLTNDTITFASPDNLHEGDFVVYNSTGQNAVDIGGLVSGNRYQVHVVNATTIRLIDPSNLPAVPQSFNGSNVASNTITITGNGFKNGQAVTYNAPPSTQFTSETVNQDQTTANTIAIGANSGLTAGEEVIYTAPAGSGAPTIGGLVSGQHYFVISNSTLQSANEIQLAASLAAATGTTITPIALTPSAPTDGVAAFNLVPVANQPIVGLNNGQTYFVINATANTFQLAATSGGPALSIAGVDGSGNALTATSMIGTEGIHLTGLGSGEQDFAIDLTSQGSGTQLLNGVGGARALAGATAGDGVVTSSAQSVSGGLVRVTNSSTSAISNPTVSTTIGTAANPKCDRINGRTRHTLGRNGSDGRFGVDWQRGRHVG